MRIRTASPVYSLFTTYVKKFTFTDNKRHICYKEAQNVPAR